MRRVVNSSYKILNPSTLHFSTFSRLSRGSHSKLKRKKRTTQEPQLKVPAEKKTINLLFKEIAGVLGAENVIPDKTPSGFVLSREARPEAAKEDCSEEFKHGRQGVCGNAEVSNAFKEIQTEVSYTEDDISRVVQEITGIVRAGNGAVPMEERLEEMEFQIEQEVVEKVLKRCFKVPNLAFRFFSWVKLKDGFSHTTETYNTMLYIAGEAREFALLDNLFDKMEKNLCEKDIRTWTIVISQYGKAKLAGKALSYFERMRQCGLEPDERLYKVMIHLLCNTGKAEIASEFYNEMVQRNMDLDLASYKMLLNGLAKLGEVDSVKLVADGMIKVSQIPERDVYVCVLKSFCVAGRIREALELIVDLKNKEIALDYEYFETLVRGLCRAERITDAMEIVEIMKDKDVVDGKVYGIIINGYLRRRELSNALVLFESMKECGHWPTISTYTELMQHLFNCNEYRKGCKLYDEMLERGMEMDTAAIMAVVSGHVLQNNTVKAWEVFKTMEDKGIRTTWKSYSVFIKALCKVLRTDEMFKVLHEMHTSKIFIHEEIFQCILSCMQKKGEIDNIRKVKEMQRSYKLHSLEDGLQIEEESGQDELGAKSNQNQSKQGKSDCHLLGQLSKAYNEQDLQEACRILSFSEDWSIIQENLGKCTLQFTPELVVEILRNCSMCGNAALQFFSWVGKQSGYHHTMETYNMAMKIAGRGKDFKHMRNLFNEMRREGCLVTPDTWAIIIMQYGRTGLTEIALKIFNEMKANGHNPTWSTYKCLIICLCGRKGRKVDEAIKLFHEMIRAGHVPDKELVETYLSCLCDADKLTDAKRCVDSLCKVGFRTAVSYSLYIRALCRAGRLEEALLLLNEVQMERTTVEQYTYGSLVHGLLRKGKLEEALARMDSMEQVGIHPTAHVYTSFIVHFFRCKQPEKALEIFQKMQQEGCRPTIVTYSSLIRGYMNVGRVADAWTVFSTLKLKGFSPDFKTYSMFINCLCKAGKSEEALQLISEMQEYGIIPSTVNYRTVFYGLNREGKQDLAQTVIQQKQALKSKRQFLP